MSGKPDYFEAIRRKTSELSLHPASYRLVVDSEHTQ